MKDRVPLYPGRVKLTPVSGQENTYDMVRADEPTQEGTPLNKNTLLKDTTAALYGLGADAVPDDVLALLSRFQSGLGNEYLWSKNTAQPTYTAEEKNLVVINNNTNGIYYSDSFTINSDGLFELVNPTLLPAFTYITADPIKGKYYIDGNKVTTGDVMYKCAYNATFENFSPWVRVSAITMYTNPIIKYAVVDYVNSSDPSAYPPAVSDGYTYMALGQLGAKTQMATGSYVGTGTSGESNPTSLTFDFEPKLLLLIDSSGNDLPSILLKGGSKLFHFISDPNNAALWNYSFDGNSVSWYYNGSSWQHINGYFSQPPDGYHQCNKENRVYYYLAIG